MMSFATYLHPQSFWLSKPTQDIAFGKYSLPYYNRVRFSLQKACQDYPSLPLKKAQLSDYLSVHTRDYLHTLVLKALDKPLDETSLALPSLSGECQGLEYALPGYCYGLGGMMEALEQMQRGSLTRAYCFSMVGHHAHRNWGHGYCLLNPLAAATRYAQSLGFAKVLILDWDIHHGDGTQDIFSHDPSVYCISIHNAVDLYMAKASDLKLGTTDVARAMGHCNIPILTESFPVEVLHADGMTGQFYPGRESLEVFRNCVANLPWQPNLMAIFSGYDSHQEDCGQGVTDWTTEDFATLTTIALDAAKAFDCPILSVHGGGYRLPVTVAAAMAHIQILAGDRG